VEALIQQGAKLETAGANQRTALWNAVYANNAPIADLLIKAGADLKVTDLHGETLLMAAARRGSVKLVQELIGLGLNVNQRDRNGSTALHYTTCADGLCSAKEVAALLLDNGAYIDSVNDSGETPLSRARSMKPPHGREMSDFLEARALDPEVARDPAYSAPFLSGTERNVQAMKVLKLKPAVALSNN
jgi:ankyrin repeat protein